jgi:DNA polymerase III alpha subunit (gram-positive type)
MFTGPGKVYSGQIAPLPRKQSIEELSENLMICSTNEMIDKLSVYAEAGVDEIIISSDFGQTQSEMIDSMYRISEEVIPFFRDSKTRVA